MAPVDAWLTAKDAARLYGVTPATIHRWARDDGWKHAPGRPVRYRWSDAQDGYEKRIMAKRAGWLARRLDK